MSMIELYSDEELIALPTGSVFVYDVECYKNYFLIAFRNIVSKKHVLFELSPDSTINYDKLRWFIWRHCLVGFNSRNYDILMLGAALNGLSTEELKKASDTIIFEGLKPWHFKKQYSCELPMVNHIDLMEVAPLEASLKLYGGRLHCKTMRDLPYPDSAILDQLQAKNVCEYCCNDLELTELLLEELQPHIDLRVQMGKEYGRDFRSLSDAQLAERVIGLECQRIAGFWPTKPESFPDRCRFTPHPSIKFQTPALQRLLQTITETVFDIDGAGRPIMPEILKELSIPIGKSIYKLGMGGLHSQEKQVRHLADENNFLLDIDVSSYYPQIILNQRLFPKQIGEIFLAIFQKLVTKRLDAKKAKDVIKAGGLKIAINGTFGKSGDPYSFLYAPEMLLQVTLSGQLYLLMLIEAIELIGLEVVSGNTDGVLIKCPASRYNELKTLIANWEKFTSFVTEETRYKAIYNRDVNNYIAVKDLSKETEEDKQKRMKSKFLDQRLGLKAKGRYCERGSALDSVLSKNPENLICTDAVMRRIVEGVSIEHTIRSSKDVRRFVNVRRVNGGATKNGEYLGKAIRYYYATAAVGSIKSKKGHTVSNSAGSKPIMTISNEMPSDINFRQYEIDAKQMLIDIAFIDTPKTASLF